MSGTAPISVGDTRSRTGWPLVLAVSALVVSACSGSAAEAEPDSAQESFDQECSLGLDLWDSDPALTWIQDGRVWVRTGDHQACLDTTDATELWWSPDGRRLLLDDDVVEGAATLAAAVSSDGRAVVWQQPHGMSLQIVDGSGQITADGLGLSDPMPLSVSGNTVLLASHPDGDHFAAINESGGLELVSAAHGARAEVLTLPAGEIPTQLDFSPDGSRLWLLTEADDQSQLTYVDLVPISAFLDIPPVESIVPVEEPAIPPPDLYFVDANLASNVELDRHYVAVGNDANSFVLHPAHPDWIVVSEGSCANATSTWLIDGEVVEDDIAGSAVGFFRGRGLPILATTSAGPDCGPGQLWVVDLAPLSVSLSLVADGVDSADIRDEAPDPWNPNAAPPFA